jgi:hypothetical protein
MSDYQYEESNRGAGWLLFAGVMIALASFLNIVGGISAISDANFYVGDASYQFGDLNTWGWILLLLGLMQGFAAFSIWSGGAYGQWLGVISATLNAAAQLFFIPAFPLWSLAIFSLDILVIYGLIVYGNPRGRAKARG